MAKNKKLIASVAAVATSAALLLGGTLAWQSTNQTALNEASDVINPGGRLHDDFDGTNKDVYVENFAEDPIYARVRLEEYFEVITNYGKGDAEKVHEIMGTRNFDADTQTTGNIRYNEDSSEMYEREYAIHYFDQENPSDEWWTWTTGGSTIYMPTFNLNKDSLAADLNGVYADAVGGISNRDDASNPQYEGYVDYSDPENATKDGTEIYDGDTNTADEVGTDFGNLGNYSSSITTVNATHTAKATGNATLISMDEWINDYGSHPGEYWVYDTDGWVYWAQPIPGRNEDGSTNATGLLLDGIKLNQVMDDTWYYAINVVAQFITADDMGKTDGTGFYDTTKGTAPSSDALTLLKAIGVEVPITTQAELQAAFEQGGEITLPDVEITSDEAKDVGLNVKFAYSWTEGGTLNGGTLNDTSDTYAGLFINNEDNWPVNGDRAIEVTVNDTEVNSNSDFAVYVQAIDAPATLNNMKVRGANGGVYAEYSEDNNTVTLNNLDVVAESQHSTEWVNTAVAAANGANVEINGGTYTGDYAVYVYSSGGTVTVNGGTFTGELRVDKGSIIITGGTFTVDPTAYVAEGYVAVKDEEAGTWTVQADTSDKTAPTVSITDPENFKQIITISDVSDEDFPLTVEMYELTDESADYEATEPAMTITITKTEDGEINYEKTSSPEKSYHILNGVTILDNIITIDYNLAPPKMCYLHAVVKDASGNENSANMFVPAATGCFAAGTQVLTEEGLKNIEDITLGELVWSVNMETYQSELKPVTYVQGERYIDATYTLYVGGEKIVTTYEHPFYANGEWTAAEDLKAGDMLRRMDGTKVAIDKVVYTELAEPLRVYNFTVDENHCYIVSAEQLLVHNISK